MSNTYTGNLEPPVAFTSQPGQAFPSDRQGTVVEISNLPPGKSVDNIFFFNSPNAGNFLERVIDGPFRAVWAGIYADGTDQTAKLNTLLTNPNVKYVIFDQIASSAVIVISGLVTVPAGVTFEFKNGNILGGTGTINGGIIDAGDNQQIFMPSLTVNPLSTVSERCSVKWFGAKGDDSVDDSAAIQRTIDFVIANQGRLKTVYFPAGSYIIDKPLIVSNWDGSSYRQVSITLQGESDFSQTGNGTRINVGFKDTFAIGLQQGKGCKIEGLLLQGQFTPPAVGDGSWYSLTLAQFVDQQLPLSRDSQYSPYSGIVIDPFSNSPINIPSDGGYPGLTSYYRGPGGNGGSTGTLVYNCNISNFVVGVMNSPNGFTRNAELTDITRCQFANCKVCVAGSQDQEKANKIYDLMCWSNTHTIFATGVYGVAIPGNWYVELVNLAGNVNQLVYNNGLGYYASHFEKVFAEGIGKIGFIGSDLQSSISHSVFDLQRVDPGGGYTQVPYDWVITGYNTLFENNVIRYYGVGMSVPIMGHNFFQNCYFESVPYSPSGIVIDGMPYGIEAYGPSIFTNCTVNGQPFSVVNQDNICLVTTPKREIIYGKKKYIDRNRYRLGAWEELEIDGSETGTLEYWAPAFNEAPYAITVTTGRQIIFDTRALHVHKFEIGHPVLCSGNGYLMGIVTAIDVPNHMVTISYVPPAIVDGSYYIGCVYPKALVGNFIGDLTAGSPTINNVVFDIWAVDTAAIINTVIEFPQIINFPLTGHYQNIAKILAYNPTAKTITLDQPANVTQPAAYCGYGAGKIKKYLQAFSDTYVPGNFPASTILPAGSRCEFNDTTYIIVKTGFVNAAVVGGGETRQAQWIKVGSDPQELPDDISADALGVRIYYNTTSKVCRKKNDATWSNV